MGKIFSTTNPKLIRMIAENEREREAMNEKPLECTSCGKLKDFGEPHNFYDCVQYLKGVIQDKDTQIERLVDALGRMVEALKRITWMSSEAGAKLERAQEIADTAIKEAAS